MSPDDPRHGTIAGYSAHRKTREPACRPCRDACMRYHKLRLISAPRLVDPSPARAHMTALMSAHGISLVTFAHLAGFRNASTLAPMIYDNHCDAPTLIAARRAKRILKTRFDLDRMPDTALLHATGTRRRLEALMWLGWSQAHLGAELGVSRQRVSIIRGEARVDASTARRVRDLYQRLWDQPGPEVRTANKARREGFAPPLAWDDEEIDDPSASPHLEPETRPGGRRIHTEDIEFILLDAPMTTAKQLAERFACTPDAIQQACRRAERLDLLAKLARNAALVAA